MPWHVETTHDLGINLRDTTPLRIGLPEKKTRDDHEDRGENREPDGHAEGALSKRGRDASETSLCRSERKPIERHEPTRKQTHECALDDQADLEAP